MASINKDTKGWRILFVDFNGRRRTLRPGKVDKRQAETIGRHIDSLVASLASGQPHTRQTALWLSEIGSKLHDKLTKAGLVESRVPEPRPEPKPESMTLKAFLADHMSHGRTAKGQPAALGTLVKWRPTQKYLDQQFPGRTLESITAEDAHQFRVWLDNRRIKQKTAQRKGQPMTENAKRRHIATCKMFFNAAKRRGLIQSNPFESQVSGSAPDRSRDFYVTPEITRKLMNCTTDPQWRLLIALWRLAGLRKMEVFQLTWGDVLWLDGTLRIHSTKTAHLEGHDIRYAPLRDVRGFLEEAFQAALPIGKHSIAANVPIIDRFSESNSNLDKPFKKLIEAAGLVPWPKLFQNLRSSCETQWLKEGHRADLVASWIGHSVTIQRKNYVQHTAEDIEAFNAKPSFQGGTHSGTVDAGNEGKQAESSSQSVLRKRLQNKANAAISASNSGEAINPTRT